MHSCCNPAAVTTLLLHAALLSALPSALLASDQTSVPRNATAAAAAACPADVTLTVVYNALIWPDNDWRMLIGGQLRDLRRSGLVECSAVHVALSAPSEHRHHSYSQLADLLAQARNLIHSILSPPPQPTASGRGGDSITDQFGQTGERGGVTVSITHHNLFEYPGLHLLWRLARNLSDAEAQRHLFLYFHTKGMVFYNLKERLDLEVKQLQEVVGNWRQVVQVFRANTTVTRAGTFPSPAGFVWFNFWWARGSHIRTLVEPVLTDYRFYYEHWLGRTQGRAGRVVEGVGARLPTSLILDRTQGQAGRVVEGVRALPTSLTLDSTHGETERAHECRGTLPTYLDLGAQVQRVPDVDGGAAEQMSYDELYARQGFTKAAAAASREYGAPGRWAGCATCHSMCRVGQTYATYLNFKC